MAGSVAQQALVEPWINRNHPRGIFSAEIFGEPNAERHGWLDVVQLIHPAAYGPLRDALGAYGVDLRAVADGSQALHRMPDGSGCARRRR